MQQQLRGTRRVGRRIEPRIGLSMETRRDIESLRRKPTASILPHAWHAHEPLGNFRNFLKRAAEPLRCGAFMILAIQAMAARHVLKQLARANAPQPKREIFTVAQVSVPGT